MIMLHIALSLYKVSSNETLYLKVTRNQYSRIPHHAQCTKLEWNTNTKDHIKYKQYKRKAKRTALSQQMAANMQISSAQKDYRNQKPVYRGLDKPYIDNTNSCIPHVWSSQCGGGEILLT